MEEEMKKEIKDLRTKIDNFERKYLFAGNYKLVVAILDKLGIDNLEISYEDLNQKYNDVKYIVEYSEDFKTVTVKRYEDYTLL